MADWEKKEEEEDEEAAAFSILIEQFYQLSDPWARELVGVGDLHGICYHVEEALLASVHVPVPWLLLVMKHRLKDGGGAEW